MLVFTPEKIIGQEYHTVIVYKLLSTQESIQHCKTLHKKWFELSQQSHGNLAKYSTDMMQASAYAPWINAYFIACSRAQHTLVLMEKKTRENSFLIELFITKDEKIIEKKANVQPVLSEDWQSMVLKQRQFGNNVIADLIQTKFDLAIKPLPTMTNEADGFSTHVHLSKPKQQQLINDLSPNFLSCVKQNNLKKVKKLLYNSNVHVNYSDKDGFTALMHACSTNNIAMVELLLSCRHIDVNAILKNGQSALIMAIKKNYLTIIQALIKRDDLQINYENKDDDTPLLYAIELYKNELNELNALWSSAVGVSSAIGINENNRHVYDTKVITLFNILHALLKHKNIDLNYKSKKNRTALLVAIYYEQNDVVKLLLSHPNLDVNLRATIGLYCCTPLMLAVNKENSEIVTQLLNHKKIDINMLSIINITPLMCVSLNEKLEMVRLFFDENLHINSEELARCAFHAVKFITYMEIHCKKNQHVIEAFSKILSDMHVDRDATQSFQIRNLQWNHPVVKFLLLQKGVLKEIVQSIIQGTDGKDSLSPGLILAIIVYCRESVWKLLQKPDTLGLTVEEHRHVLETIYESRGKPNDQQHILYQILFKSLNKNSLFSTTQQVPSIADLEQLLQPTPSVISLI
jgi:ankyrin repeat protein